MTAPISRPLRLLSSLAFLTVLATPALHAQWTAPTPEELSMTSIPQVPGAPAVYLFKEQIADDALHMQSFYIRLKVLTEGGKDYANVELPFVSDKEGMTLDSISGRTIHPDGSIVPFTGKPYEKVVERMQGYKIRVKVFSLPSVEVGSIIEYRYKLRIDDGWFQHPDWFIQSDLYTRKAHYMWRPTDRVLTTEDGKQVSTTVAWTPILPPGAEIKQSAVQISHGHDGGSSQLDLEVHDIAPLPSEQFMPPMRSLAYKVLFYYTSFRTSKEYWTSEGKRWSKARDKFMSPGPAINAAVAGLSGDTQEQKLRKIYASVMALENTDFTRERSTSEERAAGLRDVKTVDDLLTRKRAGSDQMAELFVSMARAAGMKAYLMAVANRDERIFLPSYLSFNQLDDYIAIVNIDGKEMYFDPGQRYCSFGHLAWKHTYTGGLRQVDGNVDMASTPSSNYKDAHVNRIADLKLDEQGIATGMVTVTYTGDTALTWRHEALRGDETSLHNDLKARMEHLLPNGMDVKVVKVENLTDAELPLKVTFDVKGAIGSSTGKRLLIPAHLFEVNSKPKFPEAKRELPIDMHFPSIVQDAVRFSLPATLVVESAPTPAQASIPGSAAFDTNVKTAANSITLYRNMTIGKTIFPAANYSELRDFYGKAEAKDQETLVLAHGDTAAAKPAGGN